MNRTQEKIVVLIGILLLLFSPIAVGYGFYIYIPSLFNLVNWIELAHQQEHSSSGPIIHAINELDSGTTELAVMDAYHPTRYMIKADPCNPGETCGHPYQVFEKMLQSKGYGEPGCGGDYFCYRNSEGGLGVHRRMFTSHYMIIEPTREP